MKYEDVKHASHNHNLKPVWNKTPYRCDGCKETGWGLRFRCEGCNYDLHKDCALSSPSISHPFYRNCRFKFHPRTFADTYCNGCAKGILGFVYHCHGRGYNLHPCCANLPSVLQGEMVELHLHESISWSKCGKCSRRNLRGHVRGWSYRSTCKEYHFHVSCVKDLMKDLVVEKWEKGYINGGENNDLSIEISEVPDLLLTYGSGKLSWRGKMKISWITVAEVLNLIVSIVLGDPLALGISATLFFVSLLAL
ncbi:hypothetical protein AQUCO_04300071v1 [Aquilegia coerulea]|uniref:Phorbol-ester/DAG-type domain-containing protein n=1 Tax=Aquilegia coerulea TaxID=218851 RepID=A0A2G5CNM1_AQUCA|nr:hypothetical protein AQUCO_04300071v1 [Aquilegia coerulea]